MSGQLLLDTCAMVWMVEDLLPEPAVDALTEQFAAGRPAYISPISGWELGLMFAKGHLRAPIRPAEYLKRVVNLPGVKLAEMPVWLLLGTSFLPGNPPSDLADRIIAATAREYGYTVMTRDRALLDYARDGHLGVLEC